MKKLIYTSLIIIVVISIPFILNISNKEIVELEKKDELNIEINESPWYKNELGFMTILTPSKLEKKEMEITNQDIISQEYYLLENNDLVLMLIILNLKLNQFDITKGLEKGVLDGLNSMGRDVKIQFIKPLDSNSNITKGTFFIGNEEYVFKGYGHFKDKKAISIISYIKNENNKIEILDKIFNSIIIL